MKIILKNQNRVLVKDNNEEVSVNDGDIIQYTGIYYKTINDIVKIVEIETTFIGIVQTEKFKYDVGIIGIYVNPLYIFNKMNDEWNKIINYKPPSTKYFLYPHLLHVDKKISYSSKAIDFSNICENKCLNDFIHVVKCFDLGI